MDKLYIPEHISVVYFEDSAVLLDSQKGIYYGLNDSAAEFLKALKQQGSVDAALQEVSKLYIVSSTILADDLENLVNSLTQLGFLKLHNINSL